MKLCEIMEKCGLSRSTVYRILQGLKTKQRRRAPDKKNYQDEHGS